MQTQVANTALPPIVLAEAEADILADLAIAARERSPLAAGLLLQEIERASTAGTGKVPRDVVRMMSRVDFVDEDSAERHSVELEARLRVLEHLPQDLFPGGAKSGWWMKAVQLDLEAKNIIRREKTSPIRLHKS